MSKFKKAEKKKSKLRLGISGPSGSGKTYSALRLAKGMELKTAVIDSEKGSASLYADKFDFDVLEISPPFTTEKYQEAISDAVKEGYELIVIDSISHAWAGEGGLLNQKEQLDARGGNSFTNWAKMTPKQEKFINAIVSCPAHIIVTMRSKQDYSISEEGGKKKIQKVGLAPVQRDGFEYELTTVFDIAINHDAETSKDRTGIFTDKIFRITEDTGKTMKEWLESGKEFEQQEQKKEEIKLPDPPPQENAAQVAFKELQNYVPKYDPTEGALADPGEYRFDFGTFKGRMMKDIDTKEIHSAYLKAMEWVHRGNEPTSIYRVQFANMRKYLMMMGIEV